ADITRVRVLQVPVRTDDARIGQAIAECRPTLVVIDPLQGYLDAKTDISQPNKARATMEPLRQLAERYQCTILCVRHFGKDQERKAIHRGLGSVDFVAIARSVLQVEEDAATGCYSMTHAKFNLGPKGKPLAYRVVSTSVPVKGGRLAETSR